MNENPLQETRAARITVDIVISSPNPELPTGTRYHATLRPESEAWATEDYEAIQGGLRMALVGLDREFESLKQRVVREEALLGPLHITFEHDTGDDDA
jgi:hypothetical protein